MYNEIQETVVSYFLQLNGFKWQASVAFCGNKRLNIKLFQQLNSSKQTRHHLTLHEAFQTMSRIPTKFLLHGLVDIIKRFVILNSPSRARTYGGKSTRPHSGPKEWQPNARSCFFLSTQCRSNLATCCAAHITLEATNNQRKKQTASKKQWKMASTWYWTSSVSGWPKV